MHAVIVLAVNLSLQK